ncbi:3-deoxy-D-manno-octulosonic acid kinase [Marinobacter sp. SBS5]|uniref:3-deoxy-D-manno-octulosonic acid kinase n=1 Tax=Marinobacter sp. SBS5 TaxID=3401754 RepID=UPI003AAAEE9E
MNPAASRITPPDQRKLVVAEAFHGVSEAWFHPEYWGVSAEPVSSGGRGGAWFIRRDTDNIVLRHYRRGGLMSRIAKKTYFFTGFDRARSVAEHRLLEQLHAAGLPVPEPVAAIVWRYRLFWYQAAILIKRIPGAVTFADCASITNEHLWRRLGKVIRQFHDHGLDHVDLNCDNILVAGEGIYLIDFDRCRLVASGDNKLSSPWRQKNLSRLRRSVEKRCTHLSDEQRQAYWDVLLHAYQHEER